ncbi:GNAT family N-acetyltransferase [Mycetocola zhadangensis]|uniref:GNAT family N-acetyltransferase n=1 Tax=Mycetocola zhadangensis TaxID=1164595 RepID=A0A3L7J5R1_9MICO|nr:GNAT family N-acetyltransferase [Mycetocola zhadangensis]RLQ85695.1 GNAT family N-acetyltransferase [Mycetocola zhadangensis]GGE84901.1 GNAT family acetyltransferase [Mycetocola zhadangensis]
MIATLNLPTTLDARTTRVRLRRATADDLPALMKLLSDDPISASRGDRAAEADIAAYEAALAEIVSDTSNEIVIADDGNDGVLATMQLTRIPGMARRGTTRLLVEAVRVSRAHRSGGIGGAMMRWVMDVAAPTTGAGLVQLTSDEARTDAHRFYERLGFAGSHRGFKYQVE